MNLSCREYVLGDMKARYIINQEDEQVFLTLLPLGMPDHYSARRTLVNTQEYSHVDFRCPAWQAGSLCHVALREYAQGNSAGKTLKHGPCTASLRFEAQSVLQSGQATEIVTSLCSPLGFSITHHLRHVHGEPALCVSTMFQNTSEKDVTLELLTSFALDNLSPFDEEASVQRLELHRFRGGWSLEGKKETLTIEQLNLDRAWHAGYAESERFFSLGSWTTSKWFPQAGIADVVSDVVWAARLECVSSWQMELSRLEDGYSFSGGLADCETGHWYKKISPGQCFTSPPAWVTVSRGMPMKTFERLLPRRNAAALPRVERALPWIFNEWCTSWGDPTEQEIRACAALLKNTPVSTLVIDAGWFQAQSGAMGQAGCGDWELQRGRFPSGLDGLSQDLHAMNLKLGLWFELEVTTAGAAAHSESFRSMHLRRDGKTISSGPSRTFWDLRQPEVVTYLHEHVTAFLRCNGIDYLKIDYNGNPGYGCDGAESSGEGMRLQMEAVVNFLQTLRCELPDLVIENCAAGGSRLSAPFTELAALSSVTDAHESNVIPLIAANMHALLAPEKALLWVVLWRELSQQQMKYRLSSAMLGRVCLSGGLADLEPWQWDCLHEAMAFYQKIKHLLVEGSSQCTRSREGNMLHPSGIQAMLRVGLAGDALLVCHSFETKQQDVLSIALPHAMEACGAFGDYDGIEVCGTQAKVAFARPLCGCALWLKPIAQA